VNCTIETKIESPRLASQAPIVSRIIVNNIFKLFVLIRKIGIARLTVKVKISKVRRDVNRCF